ncbi:hypothetical protein [Streptomyces sp.]|uniref:hypothetical protein n=1 Tax=Streptomyces sp. TaxID=1931 RepID=UPI002F92D89D
MTIHEPTFQDALNSVIAELTPQPWDYTDSVGTTLTVIPAGLREEPGCSEVMVRVTRPDASGLYDFGLTGPATKGAAETGITTTNLPSLIAALEGHAGWEQAAGWGDPTRIVATPTLHVTVTEGHHDAGRWIDVTESVQLPEAQRLPLASALRRALDVARGWENQ